MQYGLFVFAPPEEITNTDEAYNTTRLFPNPCSHFLNITNTIEFQKLELYDIYGKLIISRLVNTNNYTLDLSILKPGMYFLSTDNNNIKQRIIKY